MLVALPVRAGVVVAPAGRSGAMVSRAADRLLIVVSVLEGKRGRILNTSRSLEVTRPVGSRGQSVFRGNVVGGPRRLLYASLHGQAICRKRSQLWCWLSYRKGAARFRSLWLRRRGRPSLYVSLLAVADV